VDLDDNNIVLASSWVDYYLLGNYNARMKEEHLLIYMFTWEINTHASRDSFSLQNKEKKLKLITRNEIDQLRKSPNQLVKIWSDRKRELGVMIDWES